MLIDAKKKEWEDKDPCRMFEGDEELFADPPPREECAICCLPLQIDVSKTMYQACCGKVICHGCIHHVDFSTDECPCPYCRTPACIQTNQKELIERLNKRADGGDCEAFRTLGNAHSEGYYTLDKSRHGLDESALCAWHCILGGKKWGERRCRESQASSWDCSYRGRCSCTWPVGSDGDQRNE